MLVKLITILLMAVALATAKRYDGDKVYKVTPNNVVQLKVIRAFMEGPGDLFDFWTPPSYVGQDIDIRVSVQTIGMFEGLLKVLDIPYAVVIEDVQQLIDRVEAGDRLRRRLKNRAGLDIVGTFPKLAVLNKWLDLVCSSNPTKASCAEFGTTTLGNSMKYIKIGNPTGEDKPKIWIEGTIHAREWLVCGTLVYLIDHMVNNQDSDPEAKRMMDTYDWIIIAVSNPDGYDYSHHRERLWRKTRSKHGTTGCYGVDGNRNFGYKWGTGGSSSSACSDIYMGPSAFSEPETKAIADLVTANKSNTHAFFSIHSYSQVWLIPYGVLPLPDDYDELYRVGKIGIDALMAVNNKFWQVGDIVSLMYEAAGGSTDWTKGEAGLKYSYSLELRPSRFTFNGFIVSESEIEPSAKELWAGLIAAMDAIKDA